ncbi:AmpG family muropeptide MFS transporter [Thaumasiovibrio sp. DFM-14]|uniref:AmpG family muropeptide MFS transporter n=1 Tax=Thaumasiovibrio sp. DFM-14 TaxID=3384792 RepID=UPI0039A3E09C
MQTQTTPTGWRVYLEKKVLIMLSLGFSSGLPILLVFGTLSFWLREADVSRTEIGFFSWVGLAYGFKWVWSPLIDRFPLPLFSRLFGRRRGWMLLSQLIITLSLIGMGMSDPSYQLPLLALFALMVAFASATQDIVIDAYRIELAEERLQAALAASYMTGYRLAMILAGAGALTISAWLGSDNEYVITGWRWAYFVMASFMLVGIITTLLIKEPSINMKAIEDQEASFLERLEQKGVHGRKARFLSWLYSAVYLPFADFFQRHGKGALLILALIATYRISDVVMGVMAYAFYVDVGFSKTEVASISKIYGVIMTLLGAGFGGILVNRFGTIKILTLGAIVAAITNALFVVLSYTGPSIAMLTLVISADNLGAGIATAAFITYISGLTNVAFSATQYAVFSSIMLLFPKFVAGFSGLYVDRFGYDVFFFTSALIGFPVLLLIYLVNRLPVSSPNQ